LDWSTARDQRSSRQTIDHDGSGAKSKEDSKHMKRSEHTARRNEREEHDSKRAKKLSDHN
jgi:hypothetical protein